MSNFLSYSAGILVLFLGIGILWTKESPIGKMIVNKYIISILMLFILNGCFFYTLKDYADSSIGSPYHNLLEAESRPHSSSCAQEWQDEGIKREYNLANGNFVHVYPSYCGCLVHWEIDKKTQLIVGYKFEGERCSSL